MSMYGVFDPEDEIVIGMRVGQDRDVPGVDTGDKSLVQQQFRDECDINNLMKGYEKGKAITHFNKYQGSYEDVSDAPSYHDACNIVIKSNEAFDTLPAAVRDHFGNDPGQFLAFVHSDDPDGSKHKRLVDWGLAKERTPEQSAPSGASKVEGTVTPPSPV